MGGISGIGWDIGTGLIKLSDIDDILKDNTKIRIKQNQKKKIEELDELSRSTPPPFRGVLEYFLRWDGVLEYFLRWEGILEYFLRWGGR